MNKAHLNQVILGLDMYFPLSICYLKKCAMRRETRKPCELKMRCSATSLVNLNQYLSALTGAKASDNIDKTKLDEIILNIMPNIWIKQAYAHVFGCETITFKNLLMCLSERKFRKNPWGCFITFL